ncbi:hypothetical protein CC78DRAFT_480947, partial [Lojkania enalia]
KIIKIRRCYYTIVSLLDSAFKRLIKGCKIAMQNTTILKAKNTILRAVNARKIRQ